MTSSILIGTSDGLYELGNDTSMHLAGHKVVHLARDTSGWWAVVDDNEIWERERVDWQRVATADGLRLNCVTPTPSGQLLGTSEAHLLSLDGDVLRRVDAFDEAEGRDTWHTPWGGPPDVRSAAVGLSGTVYANVHVGGIARSEDPDGPWKATIEVSADVHQVIYDDDSNLLLAASAWGLGISADKGESWRFHTDGLHGRYLRAATVAGGVVFVTASTGPSSKQAAVYRTAVDGHRPFEKCGEGLPEWFPSNIDTHCIAGSGDMVVFGTAEGTLYRSDDVGSKWETVADDLPSVRCVVVG